MERGYQRAGWFGLACLGAIGTAWVAVGPLPHATQPPDPTVADASVARYLPDDPRSTEPDMALVSAVPAAGANRPYPATDGLADLRNMSITPYPVTSAPLTSNPLTSNALTSNPLSSNPLTSTASAKAAAKHRANSRPNGVLNDAQIASIRARLKLTPEQEPLWPAVETALRDISYTRTSAVHRAAAPGAAQKAPVAYVDPGSPEVQRLRTVVAPLMVRLSEDQRREVNMLAHVMGLGSVVAQF